MKSLLRYWPWLLTLAAMAAALVVHGDYGVTWDEGVQARYGELSLDYFASVFRDTSCNDYLDLRFYGPLFEMIPAAVDRVLGRPLSDKFETRHLVSGLLAVLGLPAIVLIGRLFRVPWLPSLAVLALMVSPRFVGHAFNNSKDMPFAVTTLWFLWAASALVLESDAPRRRILICGVTLGLALAARPAGFPLLALYLVGTLWIAGRLLPVEEPGARRPMWGVAAAALVLGWILMVLPWPWAHSSPLGHPLEAMRASTSVATSYPVLFGGEVVTSQELPWTYLVTYLLIATPLVLLLATVVGVVMTVHSLLTEPRHRRSVMGVLVLFWLVLPLVGFVVKRPNVYDGLRHFLFLLPLIALLAALGVAGLVDRVRSSRAGRIAVALAVLLLASPLIDVGALHPYQMTYFNSLVGGLEGAAGRYETDYWVSSYREAMLWIHRQSPPGRTVRVLVAGAEGDYARPAAEAYAAPGVEIVTPYQVQRDRLPRSAVDYYLATTRYGLDRGFDGPVVHTVGRRGAVFAVVKRVADVEPATPEG